MPYAVYTPSDKTLTFYYDKNRDSQSGKTYDLNTGINSPGWSEDNSYQFVTKVEFDPSFSNARPSSTCGWFSGMRELQSITGMNYLNTSQVTIMRNMFMGCSRLTTLDLSNFNTSQVSDFFQMFGDCSGLAFLDVNNFNTANATTLRAMFNRCSGLTSLDLSHFSTAKVTNMGNMFSGCSRLSSLNLSGFSTANVEYTNSMFNGCSELTSLDLSSFNTANVVNTNNMFNNCTKLVTVYVGSGWSTGSVTTSTNMFSGCISIKGEKGTTYDANHVDVGYAHIDGGPNNPGYLSSIVSGDVNGDGNVNIADINAVIDLILSNSYTRGGDVNGDGNVNIADINALIAIILNKG